MLNPTEKSHSSNAYDWDLDGMKWIERSSYPHLLRRLRLAGLTIEVRYKIEALQYAKREGEEFVRDEKGELVMLDDVEVKERGLPTTEYTFVAFDGERAVGFAGDEWGCWLIVVASEYRSIGLGTELQTLAREHAPARPSGGFTCYGLAGLRRVHRAMVRAALARGLYSRMVRAGALSKERARLILESATMGAPRSTPTPRDLAPGPSSTWLLRAEGYGFFTLYDPKLRRLTESRWDENRHFMDRMIKGCAGCQLIRLPGGQEVGVVVLFGGDSLPIRRFMMTLLANDCALEGADLYVDPEDLDAIDDAKLERVGSMDFASGFKRQRVRFRGTPMNLAPLAAIERQWRASFDRYGEFGVMVQELAEAKFR